MSVIKSPLFWFILFVLATAGLAALGPEEQALGQNVRIVYLHAAWVLTAEVVLGLSALVGLAALITRHQGLHQWSAALGRTGIFFWLTYLPLSLWAMQTNWNGLFLSEPRFRLAVIFAVTGLLLQAGLTLVSRPIITSLFNILFFITLRIGLSQSAYVLHPPPSPIFGSGILSIQFIFIGIILLTMVAAWFMTRWWISR